eukprot:jgi/Botrbrau1/5751/Bobra.0134s0024.1
MTSEAHRELETSCWLRKHGKPVRPHLRKEQKIMLQYCFELIDSDASGELDVSELQKVFEALGDTVTKRDVEELLAQIDSDRSGHIDFPEFVAIMTTDRAAEQASRKHARTKQKAQKQHQARLLNLKVIQSAL